MKKNVRISMELLCPHCYPIIGRKTMFICEEAEVQYRCTNCKRVFTTFDHNTGEPTEFAMMNSYNPQCPACRCQSLYPDKNKPYEWLVCALCYHVVEMSKMLGAARSY